MEACVRFPPYQKHLLPKTKQQEEEDEKIYSKYSQVIATLPNNENLEAHKQYEGFCIPEDMLKGILSAQDHFQSQPSDILLASAPKSGTTWLKALVFAIVHRKLYSSSSAQHPLRVYNPHDLVLGLETHLHGNYGKREFDSDYPKPRLFDTHMPYTILPSSVLASGCKIVYIARNPKDNFVSAWHFIRNWLPDLKIEEMFESYVKGASLYGPYWDHVLGYWTQASEKPETVLFLKYEELQAEPNLHVKRLALFMGYPFSEDEERNGVVDDIVSFCSFKKLASAEVNKAEIGPFYGKGGSIYFRKGKVGDWENYLTEHMIKVLDDITEMKFQEYGLTF